MKSKVLSLVLALTVLCSILSVSTVSFAAVDKGEEITMPSSLTNGNGSVMTGNISFKNYGRDGVTGPIIQVTQDYSIGATAGKYPHFDVPYSLDLSQPFTFQFDFYARRVWAAFSVGDKDVFVCDVDGNAYLLGKKQAKTLATQNWHTVHFIYNGTNYAVYADDVLLGEFTEFTPDATNMRIGVYAYTKPTNGNGILAVDEVYAYQSAYEPSVVETDVITIGASSANKNVTASATFSDTYATGEYRFYLAAYDAQRNKLIGITGLDIDAAGYKELKVTFETTDAFSAVDYAKAFVWAKDNFEPTGVKALLGSEPQ